VSGRLPEGWGALVWLFGALAVIAAAAVVLVIAWP
jgi:hypothetical protein